MGSRFCQCMAGEAAPSALAFVIIGALILLAALVVFSLARAIRREPPQDRSDSDSDGGLGKDPPPRTPPDSPSGGIPLPDAAPARTRLREHGQGIRARPHTRPRRPVREPERIPVRIPLTLE